MAGKVTAFNVEETLLLLEVQRLQSALDAEKKRNQELMKIIHRLSGQPQPAKRITKKVNRVKSSAGETKSSKKQDKNLPQKKAVCAQIAKINTQIRNKSGNTVDIQTVHISMQMSVLKKALARKKKIMKIIEVVEKHKTEMRKRGVQDPNYDIGQIISKHPELKMKDVRQFLKRDLPTRTRNPTPNILNSLRNHNNI